MLITALGLHAGFVFLPIFFTLHYVVFLGSRGGERALPDPAYYKFVFIIRHANKTGLRNIRLICKAQRSEFGSLENSARSHSPFAESHLALHRPGLATRLCALTSYLRA